MNVASTAAFQPGPLMAVYYATKAYVLSFSEALADELRSTWSPGHVLLSGRDLDRISEARANRKFAAVQANVADGRKNGCGRWIRGIDGREDAGNLWVQELAGG